MADWQHSIVSFLDLIDIKELIKKGDSIASSKMRAFHQFIQNKAQNKLPLHQNIYVWNDSILFLSFTGEGHSLYEPIMKELDAFKALIDKRWKSYAISVKGKTFPPPISPYFGDTIPILEKRDVLFCFKKLKRDGCLKEKKGDALKKLRFGGDVGS